MRPNVFPPGATQLKAPDRKLSGSKNAGVRSLWREFEFWFMIIQHAIVPKVSLPHAFKYWPRIKNSLMENTRARQLQLTELNQKK